MTLFFLWVFIVLCAIAIVHIVKWIWIIRRNLKSWIIAIFLHEWTFHKYLNDVRTINNSFLEKWSFFFSFFFYSHFIASMLKNNNTITNSKFLISSFWILLRFVYLFVFNLKIKNQKQNKITIDAVTLDVEDKKTKLA